MDREGYLILPGFLNPENLLNAIESYRNRTQYIFNAPGSNDHKRRQINLHQDVVRDLKEEILSLPFLSDVHHVEDFVLLRSLPGCKRQAAHTDYIPEASLLQCEPYKLPLLFLFALEENTKLVVWPSSHKVVQGRGRTLQPIQPTTILLDRGDALVFRPDLVHAGAEYEIENIRIHCYIDSDLVKRNPNRTWVIGKHADELVQSKILD
jgi:hypothetical protein